MLNTNFNYGLDMNNYGFNNIYQNSCNDILPITNNGNINTNALQQSMRYENDMFMPESLKIGNCLNGNIKINQKPRDVAMPESSQIQQIPQEQEITQNTTGETTNQTTENNENIQTTGTNFKKKAAVAGFFAPMINGLYKVFKGGNLSQIMNKNLLIKCPIFAVCGLALGSLIDNVFNAEKHPQTPQQSTL